MTTATNTQVPAWTLGDRLRKSRRHAGFSAQQMADYLGMSKQAVANWEADRNTPARPALILWAEITDVPLDWIEGVTARYLAPRQQARPATVDYVPAGPCFLS